MDIGYTGYIKLTPNSTWRKFSQPLLNLLPARAPWMAQLTKPDEASQLLSTKPSTPQPSTRVRIPGPWDGAPHQVLCSVGNLLLPLPLTATPPACVHSLSLCVCQINKISKNLLPAGYNLRHLHSCHGQPATCTSSFSPLFLTPLI